MSAKQIFFIRRIFITSLISLYPLLTAAQALAKGNAFSLRIIAEPKTLDWNLASTPVESHLLNNLMDGLVALSPSGKLLPALAESWNWSRDGRTVVLKLRKGVLWSDGTAFVAQQVIDGWLRLIQPSTAAPYAYLLDDVVGVAEFRRGQNTDPKSLGFVALDRHTVQVRLNQPVAYWLQLLTFWVTFPVRKDLIDQWGPRWTAPGKMVTLGPYYLSEVVTDQKWVLNANPHYWKKGQRVSQVTARLVREDSTAITLFDAGELDFMTDLPFSDMPNLRKRPEYRPFPYLKTVYLGFVLTHPAVASKETRQSIAAALSTKEAARVLGSGQTPAFGWVPPPLFAARSEQDFELGRKGLATLCDRGQFPAQSQSLKLILPNQEKSLIVAQWIQARLKKICGIQLELAPLDHKAFRAKVEQRSEPLFLLSWSADFPDPDNFMSVFLSNAGNNRTQFANSNYDQLVLSARGQSDQKKRKLQYRKAQQILIDSEAVVVPLYHDQNAALISPRVSGLQMGPLNDLDLRSVQVGTKPYGGPK